MNAQAFNFSHATETGRSVITPIERAMIDDAIRAGMVRRIPENASGLPEYRWDGSAKQIVAINGPTAKQVMDRARKAAVSARNIKSAERFGEVMALLEQGKSYADIAALHGVCQSTIRKIVLRGRQKLRKQGKTVITRIEITAQRRDEIAALAAQGLSPQQIADRRGEHVRTIYPITNKSLRHAKEGRP